MAEIHRAAFPAAQAWSADVMVLQLGLSGGFGFIHPAGGMVLARVTVDEAEILTIAVDPVAQSQGLGRDLLQAAMDEAARRGAAAMFLEVSVSNAPARALYKAAGFSRVGRRRAYYIGGGDALILRASLSPPDIDRPGATPTD
jgi:ribosomal-protein-alanine N-acetyltransferase